MRRASVISIAVWATLIAAAIAWGEERLSAGDQLGTQAPPLIGEWAASASPWLLPAAILGTSLAVGWPALTGRLGFCAVAWFSVPAAAAWAVAVSAARGPDAILGPVRLPTEYLAQVDAVGDLSAFLTTYTTFLPEYTVHVRGHPPGMLLLLAGMEEVGLAGAGPAAALMILGGALAVPAALLAMREVAGEAAARRAAPFLVLAPAAIWVASSADALFAGVGAWAVALLVLATGRSGPPAFVLGGAAGLFFGAALMLSYGMALLAVIPAGVLVARRSPTVAALAALAGLLALGVLLGIDRAGFNWIDGLDATRAQYFDGIASRRPADYFLLANLAALAVATGPVLAVGLARLRDRRAWLLVGGGLAAVTLAEVSGMSRGEVERIWLPFVPWVMLAASALPWRPRTTATLLGTQAAFALLVVTIVETKW